jgi:hypothetical protein
MNKMDELNDSDRKYSVHVYTIPVSGFNPDFFSMFKEKNLTMFTPRSKAVLVGEHDPLRPVHIAVLDTDPNIGYDLTCTSRPKYVLRNGKWIKTDETVYSKDVDLIPFEPSKLTLNEKGSRVAA